MNSILSDLIEFSETDEQAIKATNYYTKGLLTCKEAEKMILEAYHDSKFYWIIKCKEEGRGGKWREYSGPDMPRCKAEEFCTELNHGDMRSVNDKKIIYKVFQTNKAEYNMKHYGRL